MKRYAFLLLLSAVLFAQNENLAEVKGEVIDMLGRPIAGAQVVYTNPANGKVYRTKTDRSGKFDMIGLMLGDYQVEITGPDGRRIYSGKKPAYAADKQALNVIHIDLSIIPTKASLAPFRGPRAVQIQGAEWRKATEKSLNDLTPEQVAQLRAENAAIARYNELTPQIQAALKERDWAQGSALLQQLVAIAPFQWELYQNLGTVQAFLQKHQDAIRSLAQGIRILQDDPEASKDRSKTNAAMAQMMIAQGESETALEQPEAAAVQFRKASEIDPKPAMAFIRLCAAEYNSGNADAALADCDRAIAADPRKVELYQVTGNIQSNLDHYPEAVSTYERGIAIALEDRQASAPFPRSNINSRRFSDPSHAIADAVLAGQMLFSAGNVYFQMKNYPKAADSFARAARLHPYPALPYFNLCATRYNMDDLAGAAAACDQATASDPKMAEPYFVKASAMYGDAARHGKTKQPPGEIAALRKYLELAPDGPYAGLARTMLKEAADVKQ